MQLKFFHLIPNDGYGGVENAARDFNYTKNKNFIYKTIFINKDYLKETKKFPYKFIKSFINYFSSVSYLISQKKSVLIISLWKSCIVALLVKLFNRREKLSKLIPFSFFGPTCDSSDFIKGPFFLPDSINEGDWIEIKQMGAYTTTMQTDFNGFSKKIKVFGL